MTFDWPISIYYEDTDAGGVVYHSNYLNFFERARTQWLMSLGIKQSELLSQDIAFVVKKADIDFQIAARFEQSLTVRSQIMRLKKASMVFHQRLIDTDYQTYCEATITVACISLSKMRPRAIPPSIIQEFTRAS
ncbi:tol-pal system-associated acyl-CoA thioesterase [Shewanella intestini]|uniref:Tol-pal system-associated acyl-CoA thioesterase n=1 Tax=Shewanella intestini TaxID=2017544 RepID=A0ABS5I638_9GAMM|nr:MULTISPECIES: tol-pal system-associated acyl-CoA thioesterase [Shewanella]MBR9729489.1 tol-pal system-associated acyl-CoA thioesterase [Shewanella intestini]MRG37581.1 tol-pal system-associated acyl-CoA thioesterase [Shewanella sp. XMDDZSB0408]